jgi:predicted O-methyltransferase YrrM
MSLLPPRVLGKLRENTREHGFRETLERSSLWLAERMLGSMLHRHSHAPLSAFAEAAASMHFSAYDLARTYLFPDHGEANLSQVYSEYETLSGEIAARYSERTLSYPRSYAVEQGSAFLLYALVRSLRPSIVLETGVANGHSSFFILNAMSANGHGTLHSIDRSPEVGCLLSGGERERWRLHVLQPKGLRKNLLQILDAVPPIDLFLHDSDHSYFWQSFEMRAALKKLSARGVLASDDCDCCYAFLDVCQQANLRPAFLVETRKVFGLAFLKPQAETSSGDVDPQPSLSEEIRLARV